MTTLKPEQRRFRTVGVVYGGESAERAVALRSGETVIQALKDAGYEVLTHDVTSRAGLMDWLRQVKADVIFPVLHGRGGEDGVLQGLLEWCGLPYVGSGVLASALAIDKLRSKWVFGSANVPTPTFAVIRSEEERAALEHQVDYPVMVKPVHEGSSIGMSRADDADGLKAACDLAFRYDREVMIEQFITGQEYTVAVVGDVALPVIRVKAATGFYDYEAKYEKNDTEYGLPSGLGEARETEVQNLALRAFRALGCEGWGRVDLMMDEAGQPLVLEANTIPGMTDHSLVPKAANAVGWSLAELMHRILATVPERRE
ncbi:D-alanine--D-alanine ligase [Saccharospirillum salsuginis]|uniref:D-alanine--D-alanine ligase n=1 Tax=Saccharospirillum salsuginis TaxID=418750 RepID=A0A918N6L6_9GAMM|nr:D-alanine--D-alanine ligase [Saccharospirillum salsuginis]GGX46706.1 D-alanine--D-alanine ligase [Saccharospirillum salsuginis]